MYVLNWTHYHHLLQSCFLFCIYSPIVIVSNSHFCVKLLNPTIPHEELIALSIFDSGSSIFQNLEVNLEYSFSNTHIQSNGKPSYSAFSHIQSISKTSYSTFKLYPASGRFSPPPLPSLWLLSPSFWPGLVHSLLAGSLAPFPTSQYVSVKQARVWI